MKIVTTLIVIASLAFGVFGLVKAAAPQTSATVKFSCGSDGSIKVDVVPLNYQ